MATDKMNQNESQVSTSDRSSTMQSQQPAGSGSTGNRQGEKGEFGKDRQEKSAIGDGQAHGKDQSQTGEPGRARDEISQDHSGKSGNSPTGETGRNREMESSASTKR